MSEREAIERAADPFVRFMAMQEPLLPRDDAPIAQYIPGVWPTMGELRCLLAAIRALPPAESEEPTPPSDEDMWHQLG